MFSNNWFRTKDSVITEEPRMEFDYPCGVYKLKGAPRRYQWLLEMLAVLFPQVEVRVGIPENLGRDRYLGVMLRGTDVGLTVVLHAWHDVEGKYELIDHPENVAILVHNITAFVGEHHAQNDDV